MDTNNAGQVGLVKLGEGLCPDNGRLLANMMIMMMKVNWDLNKKTELNDSPKFLFGVNNVHEERYLKTKKTILSFIS